MDYDCQPFDALVRDIGCGGKRSWFLNLDPDECLPELVPDIQIPAYCETAHWRQRRMTFVGAGSSTPIHRELPDNLFTLLHGEKELALFAPSDGKYLYRFGPFSGIPHLSAVDPRYDVSERFPLVRHSTPFRCRMRPGDVLLIPRGWWHAVYTIEPSIALGSWWAVGAWSLLPIAAAVYKRVFRIRT